MSDIAIRVENLGKRYRLGQMEPYRTLRDTIANVGKRLIHRIARPKVEPDDPQDLWALKDVSFEIKQGEVVGIIGRNGAGKSTLLKILSRITEPTTGRAELFGRVGSLLEVGTGFHPELTGRENIYLNGAILGMTRGEINRRFDEIVSFAEMEKFLDTPVKRYSSGMYTRLAFAVAAHLEPEILIVDEVLAVGDQAFQNKCIGKMSSVAQHGRTVLFVSHNMAAVEALCTRVLLLRAGQFDREGEPSSVIPHYYSATSDLGYDTDLFHHEHRVIAKNPVLRRLRITDTEGRLQDHVPMGCAFCFELHLDSSEPIESAAVGIHIYSALGSRVLSFHSGYQTERAISLRGRTVVRCATEACYLMPGRYSVVIGVASGIEQIDRIEPAASFDVVARDVFGTGKVPPVRDGIFYCPAAWRFEVKESPRLAES